MIEVLFLQRSLTTRHSSFTISHYEQAHLYKQTTRLHVSTPLLLLLLLFLIFMWQSVLSLRRPITNSATSWYRNCNLYDIISSFSAERIHQTFGTFSDSLYCNFVVSSSYVVSMMMITNDNAESVQCVIRYVLPSRFCFRFFCEVSTSI